MQNCTTTKARAAVPPTLARVFWFVGLWCAGVATVGAVALVFHVLMLGG
jgi:adenylylsulfate kinase-like enzyme